MKNLISFSLWGNKPVYTMGAIRNAELCTTIYFGWTCRFYVDVRSVPTAVVKSLVDLNCEVIPMGAGDFRATLWRFLAASDPDVEFMLSRDADSRLTMREKIAVDEWLASGKNFHIIRDHPDHRYRILAGMWGCRCRILKDMSFLVRDFSQEDRRQIDQEFLANVVYPRIQNDCFIHDAFHMYRSENVHQIAHKRVNYEHIGAYVDVRERISVAHCASLKRWFEMFGTGQ